VPELVEEVVLPRMDPVRLEPPAELGVDSLERLGDRPEESWEGGSPLSATTRR
jgi:hypothetical protein